MNKINALSLFACSGIGELLLHKNNINVVIANELLLERCNFYKENYPNTNMICGSIIDDTIKKYIIKESKLQHIEYIQATPPCQGFSQAGDMNPKDPRNFLIIDTIEVINQIQPKWILIENVPGFIKHTIKYIINSLSNYNVIYDILNTADYGIAQTRKRAIVLISRKDVYQLKFPKKYLKTITVKEAIGHLPSLESGNKSNIPWHFATTHNDKHILWMSHTPTGKTAFDNPIYFPQKDGRTIKGYKTTYKRIEWDKPSPTITMCNDAISSQNNVHPGRLKSDGTYSDARALTIKELMILCGIDGLWKIPDWASNKLIRHLLGECVPPCIPYEITKQLYKI